MSSEMVETGLPPSADRKISALPHSALSWWAVVMTVAIFPVAYVLMSHAIDWPILDTAFAPVLLVTLIVAAAVSAWVTVVRRKERSVLGITALVIAVPLAVFGTFMVLMHVVFPD